MLERSKFKRKSAGFIKTNSMKRIPIQRQLQYSQSSDFSSFEYQKKSYDDSEQFSPYKHSKPSKRIATENTKERENIQRRKQIQSLFSNQKLKRNYFYPNHELKDLRPVASQKYMLQTNKRKTQQIQENLAQAQQICDKIHKMRMAPLSKQKQKILQVQPKHKLLHNYKVDFEYSFDKKDGAKKNKNKQKVKDKNYKNKSKKFHKKINEVKIPEYYEYSDSSESSFQQQQQSENIQNEKDFKRDPQEEVEIERNKSAKKKFLQSMNEQNSSFESRADESDEEQIQQYTTFKPQFKNESPQKKKKKVVDKFHKTKGGVCFEFDTNQFYYPEEDLKYKIQKLNQLRQKKKNQKKDTKQDILKRRKLARAYDKQARNRIFGS